jgi:hypothetical protein
MKYGYRWLRGWRSRRAIRDLLHGHRNTALLSVAAELGIADLLADSARSSGEIAAAVGAHAPSLHRMLRGLVVIGICRQTTDGRFALTIMGRLLRDSDPDSLHNEAIHSGEMTAPAWNHLLHSVMTGETGFRHVFGVNTFEYRKAHPELDAVFNTGLRKGARRAAAEMLPVYDFSPFHRIADIGGGYGDLLAAVLKAHPRIRGVLFDQPHVVAAASRFLNEAGVGDRCEVIEGNLFNSIPSGADLHILKSIIHDWDDGQGVAVLKNCRSALDTGGRLLLVERVMPDRAAADPQTVMVDLNMMVMTGGQERTAAEFQSLLDAAGFALIRILPLRSGFSIIEGVPKQ